MGNEVYNPILRSERRNKMLGGVNPFVFSRYLDDAIRHAAVPARADVTGRNWVPMGPRNIGGRVGAIAQDPRNPSILYAGSGFGGIWKSIDSGDSWTSLDNFSPPAGVRQALPIGAIAVSRSNPQVVYVGSGEPTLTAVFKNNRWNGINDYEYPGFGLYRSGNGGTSFINIDDIDSGVIRASRFERILVDPWESERCWIACLNGLWRREPGGVPIVQDQVGTPPVANQVLSDLVIDFGDVTGGAPATFTVYAAVRGDGIYSGTFDRATATYTGNWVLLDKGIDEKKFDRVKLAICAAQPKVLYCVFGLEDNSASDVYVTTDGGAKWKRTSKRPDDDGKQAFYDLFLEVHPKRPELVFTGSVEVWRSQNSGEKWEKVLHWVNYDSGDRSQHADQHAFIFDAGRDGTVWLGNDGGISRSRNLGNTWRKKSYGILAPQFYDVTVHPTYPWVTGGGFQDNGTWVGFGGGTWYHLNGGDGGAMVFEPANLQRFITTWQDSVDRSDIDNIDEPPGLNPQTRYKSPLPDLTTFHPGDTLKLKKFRSNTTGLSKGFNSGHDATFTGVVEHHPTTANHFIVGRKKAAYLTTDGNDFQKQKTGDFAGEDPEVSTVAYAPSAPDTTWWIGTSQGEVFMTANAGVNWSNVTPPDLATIITAAGKNNQTGLWIGDIAIHPTNPAIVAVAVIEGVRLTLAPGSRLYLTGDTATTWIEMSGRNGPPGGVAAANATDQMNPSAAMSVVFDPNTPGAGAQILYVGTLAGVHVIRNAVPPTAAAPVPPAPVWRTFNNNLPLTLVYDMVPVVVRDAANTVVRTALRCATHGRGVWECDLAGAKTVELFIRNTPISDGRLYSGAASIANDPRLVPAPAMRFDQGFDVRVALPLFDDVEGSIDGAEFDEMVVNVVPVAGLKNTVFVQVHTNGHFSVDDVRVQLYFANAPNNPPSVPDLQADFWTAFPNDPPAGAWRKGATEFVKGLGPAQPVVARLEWIPPLDVGSQIALLVVCTRVAAFAGDPLADDLKAAGPTLTMDPANAASLVRTERRAALRVTAMDTSFPTVFVRDSINDAGLPGSVAWGGRSPDIIVRPAAEPDPATAFADLGASREDDVVIGDVTNHIYVRVSNRMDVEVAADVELYNAPSATLHQPGTWQQVGATVTVNAIPTKGNKLTPAFELPNPADPSPAQDYKAMILVAVVYRSGTGSPSRNSVTDLTTFWHFLTNGKDPNTDMSAACRGLRWKATQG